MSDWINHRKKPFTEMDKVSPRNFYFLYAFLGDGYQIHKQEYRDNLKRWKNFHQPKTGWTINILRRDYDGLDLLVSSHFSWFLDTYLGYPKNIQRCDVIRYMLMYQYGGVYSDLDVTPKNSVDNILDRYPWANVIFGVGREKPLQKCQLTTRVEKIRRGEMEIPTRIANYFFISRIPNHPIWIDILKLAKTRSNSEVKSQYGIIYTTGPDVVTTALSQNRHKYQDIAILPHHMFTKLFPHGCTSFTDGSWRKGCQLPVGEGGTDTI